MTILGKMLTFLVLVLAVVWNGLVVNAYVTRSNWRAEVKKYQDKAVEAAESANSQAKLVAAQRDAAADSQRVLREEITRLDTQLKDVRGQITSLKDSYDKALKAQAAAGEVEAKLQANNASLIEQVNNLTTTLGEKEGKLNQQNLEAERAKAEQTRAQLEAAAYQQRYEKLNEQYQNLQDRVRNMQIGNTSGTEVRAAAPTGFRGTVRAFSGDLVAFTPGLDAGLQRGAKLTAYRYLPGGGGKYLGTVTVTDVSPKEAVGRFVLPPNTRPSADNYPRSGDELKPN